VILPDGTKKQIIRKVIFINYTAIRDGQPHYASFSYSTYGLSNCYITDCTMIINDAQKRSSVNIAVNQGYAFYGYNNYAQNFFLDYIIPAGFVVDITQLYTICEFYR
ncbi:hypothetical protein, partial [Brachyspira intermedia]|uniref:hypothetical protein n=1 Tax=Brachyspira intermedia TaxID=84377 RepID=UPI003006706E